MHTQASIFGIPQDLAAAIEIKKNSIQNGQEFNLSLYFNNFDSNSIIKNRLLCKLFFNQGLYVYNYSTGFIVIID